MHFKFENENADAVSTISIPYDLFMDLCPNQSYSSSSKKRSIDEDTLTEHLQQFVSALSSCGKDSISKLSNKKPNKVLNLA